MRKIVVPLVAALMVPLLLFSAGRRQEARKIDDRKPARQGKLADARAWAEQAKKKLGCPCKKPDDQVVDDAADEDQIHRADDHVLLHELAAAYPQARQALGLNPSEPVAAPEVAGRWDSTRVTPTVRFPEKFSEGWTIEHKEAIVRQTLDGASASDGVEIDRHALYGKVLEGVDAVLVRRSEGAEEFLRMSPSAAGRLAYTFRIESPDHRFAMDERLTVVDGEGRNVLELTDVVYWRSGGTGEAAAAEAQITVSGRGVAHLAVTIPAADRGSEILFDPGWTATSSLPGARLSHTSSILANGKVLVVAGNNDSSNLSALYLCDPAAASLSWAKVGSLSTARTRQSATVLADGRRVLIAGGRGSSDLASCQVFEEGQSLSSTGSLKKARSRHTAVLLGDGRVLVTGGVNSSTALNSAELYSSGSWAFTSGSMASARTRHTATRLADGRVLIVGGQGNPDSKSSALASCEIFNPATGLFSTAASMAVKRYFHAATRLTDGRILVTGGYNGSVTVDSCEIFDPATNAWSGGLKMAGARERHVSELLGDGTVLVAGGINGTDTLESCELYNGSFVVTTALGTERYSHASVRLLNGDVLVSGGADDGDDALSSCEIFDGPAIGSVPAPTPTPTPTPAPAPSAPACSIASPAAGSTVSGTVLVTASASAASGLSISRVEIYLDGALAKVENSAPYEFSWNTTASTNGSHALSARAFDSAGMTGDSASVSVTVGNSVTTPPPPPPAAPVVSISSPAAGTTVSGTVAVTASASAASGLTISQVEILVDGTVRVTDSTAPYSYSWDTTLAANGGHTLSARATDSVGGVTTSASVSVTVSNSAPAPTPTPSPSTNDVFGIRKIFQTKAGGDEWFMSDPNNDSRFDPKMTVSRNSDGSYRISSSQVRMNVYSRSGSLWRDVEMTGHVKLTGYSVSDDEFTWYARGGRHSSDSRCTGSAYKGSIGYQGDVFWKKEVWHTGGYTGKRGNGQPTGPLMNRWIGWKIVMYNINSDRAVHCESWLDANASNNWVRVNSFEDTGGWNGGSTNPDCFNPLTGAPRAIGEIILWGGPIATFRADSGTFDFRNLSVREIQP